MPVVDASVVVDWVAPDADPHGSARRLLERWASEGVSVTAPRLMLEEVANALLTGCRRGRWDGVAADAAWELSRRHDNHPVHEMVYVALARRLDQQLVTADAALRRRLGTPGFVLVP